ncbi:MAG: hypothetical protein ACHP93_04575, partial [Solirubrobacterales bacterium]
SARAALAHSYRTGFTSALSTILLIAAAIALTGSVFGFALVRGRDFISSEHPEELPEGAHAHGEPLHVTAA